MLSFLFLSLSNFKDCGSGCLQIKDESSCDIAFVHFAFVHSGLLSMENIILVNLIKKGMWYLCLRSGTECMETTALVQPSPFPEHFQSGNHTLSV